MEYSTRKRNAEDLVEEPKFKRPRAQRTLKTEEPCIKCMARQKSEEEYQKMKAAMLVLAKQDDKLNIFTEKYNDLATQVTKHFEIYEHGMNSTFPKEWYQALEYQRALESQEHQDYLAMKEIHESKVSLNPFCFTYIN